MKNRSTTTLKQPPSLDTSRIPPPVLSYVGIDTTDYLLSTNGTNPHRLQAQTDKGDCRSSPNIRGKGVSPRRRFRTPLKRTLSSLRSDVYDFQRCEKKNCKKKSNLFFRQKNHKCLTNG